MSEHNEYYRLTFPGHLLPKEEPLLLELDRDRIIAGNWTPRVTFTFPGLRDYQIVTPGYRRMYYRSRLCGFFEKVGL